MKRQQLKKRKTDEELLKGLAENDNGIIYMFYDLYFPMVRKMVLQNNGNETSAKDLFQEALMVLYNKAREKEFALTAQLHTYLYAVCRRLWLKELQQKSKDPVLSNYDEDDENLPDITDDLTDHEAKEQQFEKLNLALNKLGSPCKDLLEDFYINRHSMQQLADKYNYTNTDNAKTQKYKCIQRLKKIFFQETVDLTININGSGDER